MAMRKSERVWRRGVRLFWVGLVFWVAETWYFGWNWRAQSAAEVVCDLIAVVMWAVSLMLIHQSRAIQMAELWSCIDLLDRRVRKLRGRVER